MGISSEGNFKLEHQLSSHSLRLFEEIFNKKKDQISLLTDDFSAILSHNGTILICNKFWKQTFQSRLNDFEQIKIFELFIPEDRDECIQHLKKMEHEKFSKFICRALSNSGVVKQIEWYCFNLGDYLYIKGKDISTSVEFQDLLKKRLEQLEIVNLVVKRTISILNLTDLLNAVVEDIQKSFNYHNVCILLYDKEKRELGNQAMSGFFKNIAAPDYVQSDSDGLIGLAARKGETIFSNDVTADPRYIVGFPEKVSTRSEACIPVKFNEETIAVLDVQETFINAFDEIDIQTLETLAGQIGIAINNAKLYEKAEREIVFRKEAEKSLLERKNELKELNKWKDELFSILAHDLRSPYQGLLGFLEMLQKSYDEIDEQTKKEILNDLTNLSLNSFRFLEDLLEWSRLQLGKKNFNPTYINLFKIVYKQFKSLQYAAEKKRISLESLIDENTTIYADENILSIILRNLILNGIKFTHDGGKIIITHKIVDENIFISVSDTGIGIPESIKHRLFDTENGYHTYGTNGEKGSGMGLLLCKELVEKSGGKIWVESIAGNGSKFTFTLPVE